MLWRTNIGSATLYGIKDGSVDRDPAEYLIGSTPVALAPYRHLLNSDGTMPSAFTCYLFDTGSSKVMVDTGFGLNVPEGQTAGDMPAALATIDVSPTDIDHVVFTHLHPDHILGSLDESALPFFSNAAHWTLRREVEHWRAGTDDRSQGIARVANHLDEAGVLNAVDEPGRIIQGVDTIAAYGHTPGHTNVRLSAGDDSILIVGDMTFTPIQLDFTDWGFPFDVDKAAAARTRTEVFNALEVSGERFAAGHFAPPGIGRVVAASDGRRFEEVAVERID